MAPRNHPLQRLGGAGALALVCAALAALLALLMAPPAPALTMDEGPDQLASLVIVASPAVIPPGGTGDFRLRITNNSGADRVFSLTANTNGGVILVFPGGTQVSVADGSSAEFTLSLVMPSSAVPGSILTQIMFATSIAPSSLQLSIFLQSRVGERVVVPTPSPSPSAPLQLIAAPGTILPGTFGNFRFRLTNTSGADRTFILTTTTSGGVTVAFPEGNQVVVADGGSAEFTLSVLVPTSSLSGSALHQAIYVNSNIPTALQFSTVFSVLVGGATPTPTRTPYAVLHMPLVRGDGRVSTPTAPPAPTMAPPPTASPQGSIRISDIFCRDPAFPEDSEYIELRNDGAAPVYLGGWRITNVSRINVSYIFPGYTIAGGPDVYLTLYSGIGTNRPDFAEFYWNRSDQLWYVGDRAELRDTSGNLVDAYLVTASNCS